MVRMIKKNNSSQNISTYRAGAVSWRHIFLATLVIAGIGMILLRLYELQIEQHGVLSANAKSAQLDLIDIPAQRGVITDANGLPLALSVESWDLYLDSVHWIADPNEAEHTASELVKYLGDTLSITHDIPKDQLLSWLIHLGKDSDASGTPLLRNLDLGQRGLLQGLSLYAVQLQPRSKRIYPDETATSQLIGYVNSYGEPLWGIEKDYDSFLSGTPGWTLREQDALGGTLGYTPTIGEKAIPGNNLKLTIDSEIQQIASSKLSDGIKKYRADAGDVIVVDLTDGNIGAIRAMYSYPSLTYQELNSKLTMGDIANSVNSAVAKTYEPGSVFKPLSVAIGIDLGLITEETVYKDIGILCFASDCVDGAKISNWEQRVYGEVTVTEILNHSINTGAAWIGGLVEPSDFYSYMDLFNIGHTSGLDIRGEVKSDLVSPDDPNWTDMSKGTQAYGHGVRVTPLQALMTLTTFYTDGCLATPYLIGDVELTGGACAHGHRVISTDTANTMMRLMETVVESNEWHAARIQGHSVGGKTGTAIRFDPVTNKYDENQMDATFIGFVPAREPSFGLLVRLSNPRENDGLAGLTAAPIFSEIAAEIIRYREIPSEVSKGTTGR